MNRPPMRPFFLISFLLLTGAAGAASPGYGDPVPQYKGFPSWLERQVLVLTNAVRMAPAQYRDAFLGIGGILEPESYPAVPPVYWNLQLNRSSRAHSIDMADNCGLQHESCDGTETFARIRSYYKANGNLAENIAYGSGSGFGVMRLWLLETSNPAEVPADKSGSDLHRATIMNAAYHEMGAGYALGPSRQGFPDGVPFWTQDFGGGESAFDSIPIPMGSHFFIDSGKITFLVNYFDYSGKLPSASTLVLAGTSHAMVLSLGEASRGTYRVDLPRAAACRQYHFSFTEGNGKTWRYPAAGNLRTQGEGACASDYSDPETRTEKSASKEGASAIGARAPGKVVFIEMGRKSSLPAGDYVDLRGVRLKSGEPTQGRVLIRR